MFVILKRLICVILKGWDSCHTKRVECVILKGLNVSY